MKYLLLISVLSACGVKEPPDIPSRPLVYIGRGDTLLVISGKYKDHLVLVIDHDDEDMNFYVEPLCQQYQVDIKCPNENLTLNRKDVQLLRRG